MVRPLGMGQRLRRSTPPLGGPKPGRKERAMNLYTTSVYKRLEELHPNLWEIQEFIGAEKADQLISAYVDDEGHLSPHPIVDWFFPINNETEKLDRNVGILWNELTEQALAKWYTGITKEQAQMLCEIIGYQNSIFFCGIQIIMSDFPRSWRHYHPDEGFLPIEAAWFPPIS